VRAAAARLRARGAADVPIVLRHRRHPDADEASDLLDLAVDLGAPLCDGIGDAVVLDGFADAGSRHRPRLSRAPGRAPAHHAHRVHLVPVVRPHALRSRGDRPARIKARTSHLVGLKIAVMGCIVNGPGEMADADFGYVGSGPGTVNLFVGHECVERHVPAAEATDRLVALIQQPRALGGSAA
jgi:(E)-4-hydroxy-3-methylbut-2-enyl-diphosphate synthase